MEASGNGKIAFVGFGEAAMAFLSGWRESRQVDVHAYDIKTDAPDTREAMLSRFRERHVAGALHIGEALRGADSIFSVVTADQALAAAESAASDLAPGALWLDCNSCAPETKRAAACVVEAVGAHYVDIAIMAPVIPHRHKVPVLVSGPHADTAAKVLASLDMRPEIAGDAVGQASSVKMLRSVMIKGMEALSAECFLAARRAGVDEQVLTSLEASNPEIGWREQSAYNLERMMVHGRRRAAEMREAAATVRALGLPGHMSDAIAEWQEQIGKLELAPGDNALVARTDSLLKRI